MSDTYAVGLRGEDDLEFHRSVGERMHELYEQTYGKQLVKAGVATAITASKAAYSIATSTGVDPMPPIKVAYSMPSSKVAWSMAPDKVAWSMSTVTPGRYVRPTLSRAAE